jgi:hypothetical protein
MKEIAVFMQVAFSIVFCKDTTRLLPKKEAFPTGYGKTTLSINNRNYTPKGMHG